jgi:PAS domain S-box-containing protein
MAAPASRDSSELRRRAEQVLAGQDDGTPLRFADVQSLLHELEVHRVELEMQNTALRESQRELELSRDRYADLYDFAPVSYVTLGVRGQILEANLTAATMFNTPRKQLEGRSLASYLAADQRKPLREAIADCLASNRPTTIEAALGAGTGRMPRTMQLKIVPVEEADRERWRVRVALTDITDLHAATHAAEQANQSKSRFLANMSHEIRTPMAAILGYAELLEEQNLDPGERSEYLATIRRNGQALLELINDVLDLSRIEAGRLIIGHSACNPRAMVDDIVALFHPMAADKQLRLTADPDESLPAQIETDPARLRQILVNLVANAVKFTERGEVRIAAGLGGRHADNAQLWFRVIDTGIGIAADQLELIFQPFTQIDDSSTRRHGGSGLGLSISRRLAELLGGSLQVESEVGAGSTFTLWIEAGLPAPSAKSGPASAASKPASVLQGRVLVVDDARDVLHLVRRMLERAGLEVDVAENGDTGCRRVLLPEPGRPYDLVLMDVQMPDLDGFAATARLRQGGWNGPIVALTAYAMAGDRERCLAAGFNDYLSKPVDRTRLLEMANRWIAHAAAGYSP